MVQKSGIHQLRLVVYPIIYRVLCIPGGVEFLPSTVVYIPPGKLTAGSPENHLFEKEDHLNQTSTF